MRTLLVAMTLLAAACTTVGAGTDALRARISPRPASLTTDTWTPTVTLMKSGRPAAAPLALTIRRESASRTFKPRAARRGSYRVRITFPSEGRWTWALTSRKQTLARGAVTVTRTVRFELPYDLAVTPDGSIYFLDRGRILYWDAQARRISVYVTTQSEELVALVRAADGTLYVADLPGSRILRVATSRRVTEVAPIVTPGDIVLDATGTTLWAGSLQGGVFRVDIASGTVERIDDAVGVHGIDRDAAGNLFVHDAKTISRIDAATGSKSRFANIDGIKILVAPDGSLYTVVGSPSGGRVIHVARNGSATPVVGSGALGSNADGRALDVGILPAAIQFAPDGSLLVTEVQPGAAIRRVDLDRGTITTVVRGR
jgi:streptogramin lyase